MCAMSKWMVARYANAPFKQHQDVLLWPFRSTKNGFRLHQKTHRPVVTLYSVMLHVLSAANHSAALAFFFRNILKRRVLTANVKTVGFHVVMFAFKKTKNFPIITMLIPDPLPLIHPSVVYDFADG